MLSRTFARHDARTQARFCDVDGRRVGESTRLSAPEGAGQLGFARWARGKWPTLLGSVLICCGKLWFLDRMVWLYEDRIVENEQYRSWLD